MALVACDPNVPLQVFVDIGDGGVPTPLITTSPLKNEVDLLFMIDDSGSMQPKQAALRARFPQLIAQLDALGERGYPASYHIGVVTSDLGAPGLGVATGCGSSLGGKLQAVGLAAPAGCVAPVGASYIVYDQMDHSHDNLPAGVTVSDEFGCMATVTADEGANGGHVGCGFESQLESVYVALHDPIAENVGFLRPDALLVVVWVTDEDDCSMPADSDLASGPVSTYGPLASYRCTRYGVSCDGQFPLSATPAGTFAACQPATSAQGSKLVDVQKYVDFFTRPSSEGGIKTDPRDVILAAISAPATPFVTDASESPSDCGAGVASCTILGHSCVAGADAAFFGDPAVRLDAVVQSARTSDLTSICATDYQSALTGIGNKIISALEPTCIAQPLATPNNPQCSVYDTTQSGDAGQSADGGSIDTALPECDVDAGNTPCWRILVVPDCPEVCDPADGSKQHFAIQVERGSAPQPASTLTTASCIAVPPGIVNSSCGG